MADDPRVQELLDELLDSGATPEEVCGSRVELLPVVQNRWRQVCRARAELDALFPPAGGLDASLPTISAETPLPTIPGYEVEAVLGVGGMGVVFRARHMKLNRVVALKMALAGAYAGAPERERFQREAEAVAALRHPNVVQVFDVGDAEGRPYFTMEYVEGGTLAQKFTGVPLPTREAAALSHTLAVAVHAAHAAGIVHRDLKPANVLLTADSIPKVSDFGLARRLGGEAGLTRTGTAVGTPSYMAPEQARGEVDAASPAADIYALGAILYEMLTGRPPFRAESGAETVHQLLSQHPVPPSRLNGRVPRDPETICLKCLHKEPNRRYATAAALAEDLDRYLRGKAIAARPESRFERLARWVRQRPVLTATVASGTLFAVVLVGSGLWLICERAAVAREVEAERVATERATAEDLRDMTRLQKESNWPGARDALERARGRLGDDGPAEQRRVLDQGIHDLQLVAQLESIRIAFARGNQPVTSQSFDEAYKIAFRKHGLGDVNDAPEDVAGRVRESNISSALVAALDHWSTYAVDPRNRAWVLEVASRADPDPAGWRDRARDPNLRTNPAALVEVVRSARVAEQSVSLLLALDRQLDPGSPERLPFLKKVQQAHPDDFWANITLGDVVMARESPLAALRYHQAAVAIRPRLAIGYFVLGVTLSAAGLHLEAVEQFRRAVKIDPTSSFNQHLLAHALSNLGLNDEATEQLRTAVGIMPHDPGLHAHLGRSLEVQGLYVEAVSHHQQALTLDPNNAYAQSRLRAVLPLVGKAEDVRTGWLAALEVNPLNHDACYGYAEFCFFLGNDDAYHRARQSLLSRFGTSTNPFVAARTALACLLRPVAREELSQAVALAERAVAVDRAKYHGNYPDFLFVHGLAKFRQGQYDQAIATMRGDASRALGPAPRLVLAMALYRTGQAKESRKTLATAVLGHDWRANQVLEQDGWIYHILRREAETMILPNLPAFLNGKYQPQDDNERLALLGVCQFMGRTHTLTRLYADAFATDPLLADDVAAGHRYNAARAAILTSCGRGDDARGLKEEEERRWRAQARQWLWADLTALGKSLDSDPMSREMVRQTLRHWRNDPDFAALREPIELNKLPADERKEWVALWRDFEILLKRALSPS